MELSKRQVKENNIIEAAIKVISNSGYRNAKMDEIAKQAGITKVTLYSYFQSKENLYLAVIYRTFQALTEVFYDTIDKHKSETGLRSTVAIFDSFFSFCEQNFLYSETMLDYFSMIRMISREPQMGDFDQSITDNLYFTKIQDLQNLPIKLTVKEIERGRRDGSIKPTVDPMLHTIQGWTMVVGYIKLISASGKNDLPLMTVNLKSLRSLSLQLSEAALRS
ncbi:MAG: TetR/AcrR family transcriptional regulator [Bacteroidota bacterium]